MSCDLTTPGIKPDSAHPWKECEGTGENSGWWIMEWKDLWASRILHWPHNTRKWKVSPSTVTLTLTYGISPTSIIFVILISVSKYFHLGAVSLSIIPLRAGKRTQEFTQGDRLLTAVRLSPNVRGNALYASCHWDRSREIFWPTFFFQWKMKIRWHWKF